MNILSLLDRWAIEVVEGGRAFRAFINQNRNGKTLLNLFIHICFILFLSIIRAVYTNISFFVLQSLVTCH